MQRVKMGNGETKYANNLRHAVGEFYENWAKEIWYVITSVEAGIVDGDSTWLHTMRKATPEELAQREREIAEWDAKTPDERITDTLDMLSENFPDLDW